MEELRRYQKGSVTRRHFLGVTGLGAATAVMGAAVPGLRATPALATAISVTAWFWRPGRTTTIRPISTCSPTQTGAFMQVNVFGSNEEMLAKLQAGGSGWDVYVPTNYTITTYVGRRPDRAARSVANCRTMTPAPLIRAFLMRAPSMVCFMRCQRTGARRGIAVNTSTHGGNAH